MTPIIGDTFLSDLLLNVDIMVTILIGGTMIQCLVAFRREKNVKASSTAILYDIYFLLLSREIRNMNSPFRTR